MSDATKRWVMLAYLGVMALVVVVVAIVEQNAPNSAPHVKELEQRVSRLEERMDKYGQQ